MLGLEPRLRPAVALVLVALLAGCGSTPAAPSASQASSAPSAAPSAAPEEKLGPCKKLKDDGDDQATVECLRREHRRTGNPELLYEIGSALERLGRSKDAADTYQKYVLAKGDMLTYIDRSSMELRIKELREKAATSRPAE